MAVATVTHHWQDQRRWKQLFGQHVNFFPERDGEHEPITKDAGLKQPTEENRNRESGHL